MIEINYLAILVSGIVSMFLGWSWYGPIFGKQWMALSGITMPPVITPEIKKGMIRGYVGTLVGALVTAFVLSNVLAAFDAATAANALRVAFIVWLGFFVPTGLGMVFWEGKPWKLYFIHMSYSLVSLGLMSLILTLWK